MSKPPSKPPTKPKPKAKLTVPKSKPGGSRPTTRTPKTFAVKPLTGAGEGEKILLYGESGVGKTTLAGQVPNAVVVPIDDGARKIVNPMTGEALMAITGVEDFDDLRDAVQQASSLVPENGALVLDTLTRIQPMIEAWVIENVPLEKGGKAKNLEAFGFGKGYRHCLDQHRLLMTDLDNLMRTGRNVVLLAQLDQTTVPNAGGTDYLKDVPKLIENKQGPIRTEWCEWVDHIFRVGYLDQEVSKDHKEARAGKAGGETERAVYTGGAQWFQAKSRPINGYRLPPVIGFEFPEDNSVWQFVLEGATLEQE